MRPFIVQKFSRRDLPLSCLPLILTIEVKGDNVVFKLYSNLMNAFKFSYCLS